jgi:hypothetical protein
LEDVSGRPSSGRASPFGTATYLVYPPVHRFVAWLAQGVSLLSALFRSGGPDWLTGLALPLIILAKQLVWHGVVISPLLRRFPPVLASLWSAAIYGTARAWTGSPTHTVLALDCGLYGSALRVCSGSLIPSLVCDVLWDCTILWVGRCRDPLRHLNSRSTRSQKVAG